ncbi:hypothetical protein SKAU_G00246950 [Synaphobranchus kaupii]|uniref:Uncharacterized protein n=1 Tax=Synaphobranchus kaupii TaxID=118154 RepID=A0A9Q1IRH3_SYNKA|nr:hypothetical protein SKAU_G00246950 [Synaphobranchus kaupii]
MVGLTPANPRQLPAGCAPAFPHRAEGSSRGNGPSQLRAQVNRCISPNSLKPVHRSSQNKRCLSGLGPAQKVKGHTSSSPHGPTAARHRKPRLYACAPVTLGSGARMKGG